MSTNRPIEGQVVAILGNREVLIDRGRQHGVEIGMRFVILDEVKTIEIPGSGISIPIELPKTIVKIVRHEGEVASVGRTFKTIKGRPGFSVLIGGEEPDRPETFAFEDEDEIVSARDKVVRRGDRVRLTRGDEYEDMPE